MLPQNGGETVLEMHERSQGWSGSLYSPFGGFNRQLWLPN